MSFSFLVDGKDAWNAASINIERYCLRCIFHSAVTNVIVDNKVAPVGSQIKSTMGIFLVASSQCWVWNQSLVMSCTRLQQFMYVIGSCVTFTLFFTDSVLQSSVKFPMTTV
ncbi:hypothetical protein Droror1_Dr00020201 [Drosera rotundifolia]